MHKKYIITLLALTLGTGAIAQELTGAQQAIADVAQAINDAPADASSTPKPKYWKKSLSTKVDFGQTFLANWAAGGYNTYSLKAFIDGNANYARESITWTNRLQLDYGFLYSADKPVLQKSDDRIYLESKFGYNLKKDILFVSAEYNFKSQFSNTWNYPTPTKKADNTEIEDGYKLTNKDYKAYRSLKSGILSPAYTNIALGINYTPLKWLSINFAPLTGGFVIVTDERVRKAYGMKFKKSYPESMEEPVVADPSNPTAEEQEQIDKYNSYMDDKKSGKAYRSAKFEFGAQLKIDFKVNVNDNFKFTSQIVLFSDYLDKPQNIRVNWDNRIEWKLAKYFSLMFTTNLIYDDKVLIKSDDPKDLAKYPNGRQRVQFKESLSFGFTYTIASKN